MRAWLLVFSFALLLLAAYRVAHLDYDRATLLVALACFNRIAATEERKRG